MSRFLVITLLFLLSVLTVKIPFQISDKIKSPQITQEATSSAAVAETAVVARVIDGDTIELSDKRRVRYIGINTPELVHPQKPVECFAKDAKEVNQKLVAGKSIRMEKDISDTDQYGRLLRYIYIDDIFVNDYLVRQGFAQASAFPPDIRFSKQFIEAEREARDNNRGLWQGCGQK